ncbi:hypothetical protein AF335_19605 [Streptomyces eurocidicus]|uniref:Uncharacterized protein n=1 Tax=Streptomyces eurocidicus TaxID=66423 RepID=A0A2N8NTA6_STREU|nr:hypothetical protein [Streptomyces eurocidicus]MBB5123124.1 hypothetical protein [Streptomyces eurocidicus]MBF6055469.1 hypothetical protein [Streptomyces eurocidicus]PNE31987.1 hypothetical protein AF335_19605 [Streptomyces eurocidicus]
MGRSAVGSGREVAITGAGRRLPGGFGSRTATEPVVTPRRELARELTREVPVMDAVDDPADRFPTPPGARTGGP